MNSSFITSGLVTLTYFVHSSDIDINLCGIVPISAAMIAVSVKPCSAYSSSTHCDLMTLTYFSCSSDLHCDLGLLFMLE